MKVAFYGMGYLGQVYSAWCGSIGHNVVTFGEFTDQGKAEPELADLMARCASQGKLTHAGGLAQSNPLLQSADVVWFTFDTPIQPSGEADIPFIKQRMAELVMTIPEKTPIFVSSQIPLGTIADFEKAFGRTLAYIPENVRVGRGLSYLRYPDRFVLGTRRPELDLPVAESLINSSSRYLPTPIPILVMSPEEAEMVKHTINAFLGTCITFSNEMAAICKARGLNMDEIVKAIQSEWRIGHNLPMKPGGPFKTGHIERDLRFLESMADHSGLSIPLIRGISETNNRMKSGDLK